MGGVAKPVSDPEEIEKVGGLLFRKFPRVAQYMPAGAEGVALFRVEPKVISLLDYSKGFGHTGLVAL